MAAAVLVMASISGATEQPLASIDTPAAGPPFRGGSGPDRNPWPGCGRAKPLDPAAPAWARRLYWRSLRVLLALTDPRSRAVGAGEQDGWDYVWPRDAAAGAIALEWSGIAAGGASRLTVSWPGLDLDGAARFYPDGDTVPGRPEAGDAEGWVAAAHRRQPGPSCLRRPGSAWNRTSERVWRDRQDYGENVTGGPARQRDRRGRPSRRDPSAASSRAWPGQGGGQLMSLDLQAAWAATIFPSPGLPRAVRGNTPPGPHPRVDPLRHPTGRGLDSRRGLDRADRLVGLGPSSSWARSEHADRLLAELHRAETPHGTLPERVDAPHRRPDLDHAARLVACLRDPGAPSSLPLSIARAREGGPDGLLRCLGLDDPEVRPGSDCGGSSSAFATTGRPSLRA